MWIRGQRHGMGMAMQMAMRDMAKYVHQLNKNQDPEVSFWDAC